MGEFLDELMSKAVELLTSKIAICLYIALVVLVFVVLIYVLMMSNMKYNVLADRVRNATGLKEILRKNIKINNISSGIPGNPSQYGPLGADRPRQPSPPTQRFTKLSREDIRAKFAEKKNYDGELTLEKICKDFRNFAASKLGLYYDLEQIRRFVAGMGTSKILIMQ